MGTTGARRGSATLFGSVLLLALASGAAWAGNDVSRGDEVAEMAPRIVLRSVKFAFDSTTVDAGSLATLAVAAEWMRENPRGRLRIEGHSSASGSETYNRELSRQRALAVKRVLVDYGVAADRLEVAGRGESAPLASDETPEGRALNRRVEFVVIEGAEVVKRAPTPPRR